MILIALGANLQFNGMQPAQTLSCAIDALRDAGVVCSHLSRFYKTPAWPDPSDPPYVNAVMACKTDLEPLALLRLLQETELRFGRERLSENAPRTLDLDILAYNDAVMAHSDLDLPHPRVQDRAFVLVPLSDIAPNWKGTQGKTVMEMISDLPKVDVASVEPVRHPYAVAGQTAVMGIVNITPDSFSDGGLYNTTKAAIEHGYDLIDQGADILDIGGESTRPGAVPVSVEEEIDRVIPVITGLQDAGVPLSIDTRHAAVMQASIEAGASIINDVSALTHDLESLCVAAKAKVPVCLMHMQGVPETMQDDPSYQDVVTEIVTYLNRRVQAALRAGVMPWNLLIDPGIGFGKTLVHNLSILNEIGRFHELGVPVLLGASRKSFIEKLCPGVPADQRLGGSLASIFLGLDQGIDVVRVHDVAATVQAMAVWHAARARSAA